MSVTAVSGYWAIHNKHGNKYLNWFEKSLRINCPYVFFGTPETIAIAKAVRRELPTHYIELAITDFHTHKYIDHMLVHPTHCPSRELNLIWNEKIFLIQQAARLNPFGSDFFAWVDAGICSYRDKAPPPGPLTLPTGIQGKTDRLIFTSSDAPVFHPQRVAPTNYYHYICGTAYMLHASLIDRFADIYDGYLRNYLPRKQTIYTDQVILTYIYKDRPELFYRLGHGYGALVPLLYNG